MVDEEERVDLFVGDFEGDALTGDESGGGNCRGWLRVETIFVNVWWGEATETITTTAYAKNRREKQQTYLF